MNIFNEMTTLCVIGKTGTGKSSLCNGFLLGSKCLDMDQHIFDTSASINACTYLTNSKTGKLLGDEVSTRIIDTPGLSENLAADALHIKDMVKHLKNDVQEVHAFLFTVNG